MTDAPLRLLFACNLNSIRSPMAEGLARKHLGPRAEVASCGVWDGGYLDPLMVQVMKEAGVDMAGHVPRAFEELGGAPVDLVIALTPESEERARRFLAGAEATTLERWPSPDPTQGEGSREAKLEAYRAVRDALARKIAERFGP